MLTFATYAEALCGFQTTLIMTRSAVTKASATTHLIPWGGGSGGSPQKVQQADQRAPRRDVCPPARPDADHAQAGRGRYGVVAVGVLGALFWDRWEERTRRRRSGLA